MIALWLWALLKNSFERHWASLQLAHPELRSAPTHWLALSGGADSVALLHLLHKLPADLRPALKVIHVHHGISPHADQWLLFCQGIVEALDIPFVSIKVTASDADRKRLGLEGWARTARYAAISEQIEAGDVVHCAQHQSDQAETLILALMRGAGPDGQASMPVIRALGGGWLCRPLLRFTRAELQAFAMQEQGDWIHDPSNDDTQFDRNFIRAEISPKLNERWPSANRSLARAASLAAESSQANSWFAQQALRALVDSGNCIVSDNASLGAPSNISIESLSSYPVAVRNQVLRQWVSESGMPTIPFAKMCEVDDSILTASTDKNPYLSWDGNVVLARFADRLWLYRDQLLEQPSRLRAGEKIAYGNGVLSLTPSDNGFAVPDDGVEITQRGGGERFRKLQGGQSTLLKKYLNEQAVLPWWRDRLPLIWSGGELVAVADLWQQQGTGNWQLSWLPAPVLRAAAVC